MYGIIQYFNYDYKHFHLRNIKYRHIKDKRNLHTTYIYGMNPYFNHDYECLKIFYGFRLSSTADMACKL